MRRCSTGSSSRCPSRATRSCAPPRSLVDLIWSREIDPGKVFDLALPLEEVAEGYRAMDERRAIKSLLRP